MTRPRPSILVVEDTPGIALVLRALLEGEGYRVVLVTTVAEGIGALSCGPVDLILTDSFSRTPEGVIESITGLLSAAKDTPVALLTAHDVPHAELRTRGLCARIPKPFDADELLQQVGSCLRDVGRQPVQPRIG